MQFSAVLKGGHWNEMRTKGWKADAWKGKQETLSSGLFGLTCTDFHFVIRSAEAKRSLKYTISNNLKCLFLHHYRKKMSNFHSSSWTVYPPVDRIPWPVRRGCSRCTAPDTGGCLGVWGSCREEETKKVQIQSSAGNRLFCYGLIIDLNKYICLLV